MSKKGGLVSERTCYQNLKKSNFKHRTLCCSQNVFHAQGRGGGGGWWDGWGAIVFFEAWYYITVVGLELAI